MKIYIILAMSALALAADYQVPEDPFNIDTLPDNPDEILARVNCFIDKGPCTELTAAYKELVPDIIKRECDRCTTYLKHYHHVFLANLKEKFPKEYEEYKMKYDPNGEHFDALEAAVAAF